MTKLGLGDYVLATKYADGDPFDGYAVGFYAGPLQVGSQTRHLVTDGNGKQYRRNGFRRCERVSPELGNWIAANRVLIEARTQISPINMWRYKYGGEPARRELLDAAGDLALFVAKHARQFGWDAPTPEGAGSP